MKRLTRITTAVAFACVASAADASLIDRGNGLIYDDVLNITWLQDAHLASTISFGVSGIADGSALYDPAGSMTWDTSKLWIDAMNAANYKGFSTWRLPTVQPVNGVSFQYDVSYDGSTDRGFNNYSLSNPSQNELAYLYYVELGNLGLCDSTNAVNSPVDSCSQNTGWGLVNTGPFSNFDVGRYWTGTHSTQLDGEGFVQQRAFDLDANFGEMGTGATSGYKYAWAVINGDVGLAAVPIPAAGWLLGSGIFGLAALGKRNRR